MNKTLLFLCISYLFLSCEDERGHTLFTEISPSQSQIKFSNEVSETEDWNVIQYLYFFNGGGVAVGDINNDGLPDIAFSANQLPNQLYLNKGNFECER